MSPSEPSSCMAVVRGLFSNDLPFLKLFNQIPACLVLLDTNLRIISTNQYFEALSGLSLDQTRGIICKYVIRSNLCGLKCPIKELSPDSEPVFREGNLINTSRKKIPVRITYAPVLDTQGCLAGWLESIEDLRSLFSSMNRKDEVYSFGPLLGHSPQLEKIFSMVSGIAQTDSSVLITGETGTGKDMLAELIHQKSSRAKGSFIKVNCGALPEALLESELFGHKKGAFTGATENKPGRFKLAHNGTIFLTEIGDLPLTLQVKLLSFLDDHIVFPLGSSKGTQVDVRIIAATHRNLQEMVQSGYFRKDLLYRLNVVRLHLPPLREREGDVRLLLDHFLHIYTQKFKKPIQGFSHASLKFLQNYDFPGNVRELKNIIEFAINICQNNIIELEHLPAYLKESSSEIKQEFRENQPDSHKLEEDQIQEFETVKNTETWPNLEKKMILQALFQAKGKKQKAAQILGWGRSTLWRKMKQYDLTS